MAALAMPRVGGVLRVSLVVVVVVVLAAVIEGAKEVSAARGSSKQAWLVPGNVESCNACRAVVDEIMFQTRVEQASMRDLGHMDDDGEFVVSKEADNIRNAPAWDGFCSKERFVNAGKGHNLRLIKACQNLFAKHGDTILDLVSYHVRPGIELSYIDVADFICGQGLTKMCALDKRSMIGDECTACYSVVDDIAKEAYKRLPIGEKSKEYKNVHVKELITSVCSDLQQLGIDRAKSLLASTCLEVTDGEIGDDELAILLQKPVLTANDIFGLGKKICVTRTELCETEEDFAQIHAAHVDGANVPYHIQYQDL